MNNDDDIKDLLRKNIKASNRTTHAVRAFVRFLFIQLTALTIAAFVHNWGVLSGSTELVILAVVVALIGIAMSSSAGWSELSRSELPENLEQSIEHPNELSLNMATVTMSDETKLRFEAPSATRKWEKLGKPTLENWDPQKESFGHWLKQQEHL